MGVIQRVVKPTTQRGKRALEDKAPKIIENDKTTLFIHGQNTSPVGRDFLKSIYRFKKLNSLYLGRKNPILPFDDVQKMEWLSKKHDASLFAMTTHSKKRPDNFIFGRMFNHQLLDMIEFGLSEFRAALSNTEVSSGTKPCILFQGVAWQQSPEHARIKSLFLDFFRGPEVQNVSLVGFELAIQFTAVQKGFLMRSYRILLKKSGTEVPRVELKEIGPSVMFTLRRTKIASEDLLKTACKKPKALKVVKKKNLSRDVFGTKLGRVHMKKQHMGELQVRKTAAIKKAKKDRVSKKRTERALTNAVNSLADE